MMPLTNFSTRHRIAVFVLMFFVTAMGAMSYMFLPRESFPDIKMPLVTVVVPLPEASPADVENGITIPLERQLKNLKGLDKLTSVSVEGASISTIQFESNVQVEDALQRTREKFNVAKSEFPDDAEDETIQELSFSEFPVLVISLYGAPVSVLQPIAEKLEDALEQAPGVLSANIAGSLEPEIQIDVDPERLTSFKLPVNNLIATLSGENVDTSAGGVDTGHVKPSVRVPGEFKTADDVNGLIVFKDANGKPVYLRDVATAKRSYKEPLSYARHNGKPAVSLSVVKRTGANILVMTAVCKEILRQAKEQFPSGVGYEIIVDNSTQIRNMVSDLENNVLSALVLVVLVIFLAMGLRNALMVSLAIPFSMLISFVVIQWMGMTLNMMVLFSLVLAQGMLVDNAIVTVENIYRHMSMGKKALKAALDGTREIAWPITTSTMTTLAAFAPMIFWPGMVGEFMRFLPICVIIVLTCSLFVALVINPVMAVTFMRVSRYGEGGLMAKWGGAGHMFLNAYEKFLRKCLSWPKLTTAAGIGALFGTFMLFGAANPGVEFFPPIEPVLAEINITAPVGTSIEQTDRIARVIESRLPPTEDLKGIETTVGGGGTANPFENGADATHLANITLAFKEYENRKGKPTDYLNSLYTLFEDIPGADIEIKRQQGGPPTGPPVNIEISVENEADLADATRKVRDIVATIPGIKDLRDDYRIGKPELRVRIDRQKAAMLGLTSQVIGSFVKMLINGRRIGGYDEGNEERDIVVRLPAERRNDPTVFDTIRISDLFGNPIPLSTVASLQYRGGAGTIRRVDAKRVATVSSNVQDGMDANVVRKAVAEAIGRDASVMPQGFSYALTGENEEQQKAGMFLMQAFMVAMGLVFLIIIAQFNSFTQSMIIMGSVIMSLIGVLISLLVCGQRFGIIMTGIGVISLGGVVVNNAIVLIDYANQLVREGHSVTEAAVIAGRTRMRPVLLTAITTLLGLLPMAVGISFDFFKFQWIVGGDSVQWWKPMATAVIFGLGVATILTTVYVPTLYVVSASVGRFTARVFAFLVNKDVGDGVDDPRKDDTPERGDASPADDNGNGNGNALTLSPEPENVYVLDDGKRV
ncbi:MAG: efflux RND transporter permease subunit [Planctomycetes bacterium]|nr:efflux RND transporter permease subunit [Planctomycetota bacterium]